MACRLLTGIMAPDPGKTSSYGPAEHRDVQRIASWLDEAFTIPGTRYRVGWDALLGLVPGAGDLLTTLPAVWIVMGAVSLGVPNAVAGRMVLNLLVDNLIGGIPLVGDLFDIAWKANRRNVRLLDRYQQDPTGTRRRSTLSLAGAALVLLLVAAVLIVVPILVLVWLIRNLGAGSV